MLSQPLSKLEDVGWSKLLCAHSVQRTVCPHQIAEPWMLGPNLNRQPRSVRSPSLGYDRMGFSQENADFGREAGTVPSSDVWLLVMASL